MSYRKVFIFNIFLCLILKYDFSASPRLSLLVFDDCRVNIKVDCRRAVDN